MDIFGSFFDSGIYVIIVIVAVLVVIIAIAILNGSSKPKKKKMRSKHLLTDGKRDHRQSTKLLKEPEKNNKHGDKRKEEKIKKVKQQDDEPIEVVAVTADGPKEVSAAQNTEIVDLPELPAADNLEESDEEIVEEKNSEDLMNIFEVEEVENSYTSDLAANLFDVDLNSLEKLSQEVLEVYSGKKKEENKEE
jgi:FtsZ-interacting cell division protein ZipA